MSGIPVYTQSPINASKVAGTTPQTTAPDMQKTFLAPKIAPATTTTIPSSTYSYPPAQPGASEMPTPVSSAAPPLEPTPTTKVDVEGPVALQPGAVPILPNGLKRSNLPPPPKAGESYRLLQPAAPPYPPQLSFSLPTMGRHPHPSTSSTTTASSTYPAPLPTTELRSLEHPPGYHQNEYASELTPEQRRAIEAANASSGLGGQVSSENGGGIDTGSMWETAKVWAQSAGEKLSEAENEVWKRIMSRKKGMVQFSLQDVVSSLAL